MAAAYPPFLEVKRTEECGRGLYAKTRIRLGTEVLTSEPYAHVLSKSERGKYCDHCLQQAGSPQLQRCSGCKFVWYCGRKCQGTDWRLHHRAECKGIGAIRPHTPTATMRLVARILQRRKEESRQPPGDWEMDQLCSHETAVSEEVREQLTQQLLGIQKLTEGQQVFHPDVAYGVLCKVLCNTFTICDESLNSIGVGIYIGPSVLNHSCEPNCMVSHRGSVLHLRASKDIQPGEQLFISYVELMDTAKRRQSQLKRVYSFDCACTRCREEEDLKEGSPYWRMYEAKGGVSGAERDAAMTLSFQELEKLEHLKKSGDWSGVLKTCEDLLVTKQTPVLQTMNVVTAKTLECCLLAHIELKDWSKALLIAEKLTESYRQYLPQYHPVLATHLVKLGKLYRLSSTTEHLELSIQVLSKAAELLSVCYGPYHPTSNQAIELLQDSQRELMHRKTAGLN